MLSGYILVAFIQVHIDVTVRVNQIDPNNEETWPNMAPEMSYFIFPFSATLFFVLAVIIDFVIELTSEKEISKYYQWFLLGVIYGFTFLSHILRHIEITHSYFEFYILTLCALLAFLFRNRFGRKEVENNA